MQKQNAFLLKKNGCELEIAVKQPIRDEQQNMLREAVENDQEIDACLAIPGQGTVREHFNVQPVRAIGHRSLERDNLQCIQIIQFPRNSEIFTKFFVFKEYCFFQKYDSYFIVVFMRFIIFAAICFGNGFGENVVSFDDTEKPTRLVIEQKLGDGTTGCKLQLVIDTKSSTNVLLKQAAEKLAVDPCVADVEAARQEGKLTKGIEVTQFKKDGTTTLVCAEKASPSVPIGELIYPLSPSAISDVDNVDKCKTMAFIANQISAAALAVRDKGAQRVERKCQEDEGCFQLKTEDCKINLFFKKGTLTNIAGLRNAVKDVNACLDVSSPKIDSTERGGTSYSGAMLDAGYTHSTGTLQCFKNTVAVGPALHEAIGEYIFPSGLKPEAGHYDDRCKSLAYFANKVEELATKLRTEVGDGSSMSVVAEPGTKTVITEPVLAQSSTSNIVRESTTLSMIGTQEEIFFTNFHNAAQQLSLLGIKAVGLATQIQAIRGHMMMLNLIDQHIAELDKDHQKYSERLDEALARLEVVTGMSKAGGST